MDPLPVGTPPGDTRGVTPDFFSVYRVAIDDLHHTRELGQKIDSLYVTIVTLLLTADAYEIAATRFDNWTAVIATVGVALIGVAVTGRWRKGADNLYQITRNRYGWLRDAEDSNKHPEMARIGANIFTQEYSAVYAPQTSQNRRRPRSAPAQIQEESGVTRFYYRTLFLQSLCLFVFIAIPVILTAVTYLNMNPALIHAVQQAILHS